MSKGTYTRRINLFINGQEVENNIKSIRARMIQLRNEQSLLTRGTAEYNKKAAQIRQLQGVLNEHNRSLRATGNVWDRLQKGVMRYARLIGFAVASLAGGSLGLRRLSEDFATFEESVKNLQSLTGLQNEPMQFLIDRAKELSTTVTDSGVRITSSAKEIIDAFALVGSQRPELLQNEQALSSVTEAALILSAAGKMQLEPAARAVTSAMNQMGLSADESLRIINSLAAGAQAGAVGIEDLTTYLERTGSISAAMNLEFEELLGLIETVGPKFSQATEGSTQLRNVLLQLASGADSTNPQIVGLTQALENLGAEQLSIAELRERFGTGNIVAAESLIRERAEVERYTIAVTDSTKAIEMATMNTDTYAAKQQQAKNELLLVSIALGERLSPALSGSITGFARFLSLIEKTIGFFANNAKAIGVLTAAIIGYTIASKGAAIAIGIKTAAVWVATRATAAWNAVLLLNPIAAITAVVFAAATALALYSRKLSDVEKAEKELQNVRNQARKDVNRSKVELDQLFKIAQDETRSLEQRRRAIENINRISPEYLGHLNLENIRTQEANLSKEKYIDLLLKEARAKAVANRLQEIEDQILEAKQAGPAGLLTWWDHLIYSVTGTVTRVEDKYSGLMESLKAQRDKLKDYLMGDDDLLNAFLGAGSGADGGTDPGGSPSGNAKKYSLNQDENFLRQTLQLKEDFQNDIIKSEAGYQQRLLALEIQFLEARLAKSVDSGSDLLQLQHQLADKRLQAHKAEQQRFGALEQETESPIDREEREYTERLIALGLFGKDRRDLTKQETEVLESMEEQHQANIAKLRENELTRDVEHRQKKFEQSLTEIQYLHAQELENFEGSLIAREELRLAHQEKEEKLVREHYENLLAEFKNLVNSGDWQGENFSELFLSDEAKEDVLERIRQIMAELIKLMGATPGGVQAQELRDQHYDIFGFTQDDWDILYANLKAGKIEINELQMAGNALVNAWSDVNQIITNTEKNRLAEFERSNQEAHKALDTRLRLGMISEQQYNSQKKRLEDELERKRAKAARNQAIRERNVALMSAIVNTAAAVAKALPNLLLAGIVAAAGALQIGIIAGSQIPDVPGAQEGGFLDVRRQQDGKKFRAKQQPGKRGWIHRPTIITGESGSEYVIPREGVENPALQPFINMIEQARVSGGLPSLNPEAVNILSRSLPGRQQGGSIKQTENISPASLVNYSAQDYAKIVDENTRAINHLVAKLKEPFKSYISLHGSDGLTEKQAEYERQLKNLEL